GSPDTRPTRRIELLHQGMHVARGLFGRYITAYGGYRHHLQTWIKQGRAERNGVVNAWIDVEDYLPGHAELPPSAESEIVATSPPGQHTYRPRIVGLALPEGKVWAVSGAVDAPPRRSTMPVERSCVHAFGGHCRALPPRSPCPAQLMPQLPV